MDIGQFINENFQIGDHIRLLCYIICYIIYILNKQKLNHNIVA